jgi:hypothetical protein
MALRLVPSVTHRTAHSANLSPSDALAAKLLMQASVLRAVATMQPGAASGVHCAPLNTALDFWAGQGTTCVLRAARPVVAVVRGLWQQGGPRVDQLTLHACGQADRQAAVPTGGVPHG